MNSHNSRAAAGRRNLLIVRAGEDSLHPRWLAGVGERNFDLLVSYYGDVEGRYRDEADHYHVMRGPRWPAHDELCRTHAELLASYDFVGFACDDLIADRDAWSALFEICASYQLDLAQPAITGPVSHEITKPVEGCVLRYTSFVEIMSPVFSRRALETVKSSFAESVSGWGLDFLWPKLLGGGDSRIAIVDAVRVRHSRPLRQGTLYSTLKTLDVDPKQELARLGEKFDIAGAQMRELSRVPAAP